ncbi:MAG: energy transducer TonB [Acidobacteria bacterium]|nr:energy transducer TonB [Acidobacteriota bacterium]
MNTCEQIQDTLLDHGPTAFQNDEAARNHLAECDACYTILLGLKASEKALQAQKDAPQDLLLKTLAAVAEEAGQKLVSEPLLNPEKKDPPAEAEQNIKPFRMRKWLPAMGLVAATLLVALFLFKNIRGEMQYSRVPGTRLPEKQTLDQISETKPQSAADTGLKQKEIMEAMEFEAEEGRDEDRLRQIVTLPEGIVQQGERSDQLIDGEATGYIRSQEQDGPVSEKRKKSGTLAKEESKKDLSDLRANLGSSDDQGQTQPSEAGLAQPSAEEPAPLVVDSESVILEKSNSTPEPTSDQLEDLSKTAHIIDKNFGDFKEEKDEPSKSESSVGSEFRREAGKIIENPRSSVSPTKPVPSEPEPVPASKKPENPLFKIEPANTASYFTRPKIDPKIQFTHQVAPEYPKAAEGKNLRDQVALLVTFQADGTIGSIQIYAEPENQGLGFEQAAIDAVRQWQFVPAQSEGKPINSELIITLYFEPGRKQSQLDYPSLLEPFRNREGLEFQNPNGYWANTYVPGDLSQRILLAQLQANPGPLTLANLKRVRPLNQPFDWPNQAALDLTLKTSLSNLNDPQRLILQVGIQATQRSAGSRPALNMAVLLDLPSVLNAQNRERCLALLQAIAQNKEAGDRIHLIVAGLNGGLILTPDTFRQGPIQVFFDQLEDHSKESESFLSLKNAYQQAVHCIDPETADPLGSNSVFLISTQPINELESLLATVHQASLLGIQTSVVGTADAQISPLNSIALRGQGNRWWLNDKNEATPLVRAELAEISRVVARALRLQIQLPANTHLVDVLGSYPLNQREKSQAKAVEKNLDVKISRQMGIQADRGEDEPGIQILIPKFMAGDSHVILLDVVVDGPGPIAEAQLRYKDLVHLRNGTVRNQIVLDRGDNKPGPSQINVLQNLVANLFSQKLMETSRLLQKNQWVEAQHILAAFQADLENLAQFPEYADCFPPSDFNALQTFIAVISANSQNQKVADWMWLTAMAKQQNWPTQE